MISIADIPALPITLANEHKVRPFYDKVRTFCQERNAVAMMRIIARLRSADPTLGELIDEVGRPSEVWMLKQVDLMLSNDAAFRANNEAEGIASGPELTRELATETAKKDHARYMTEYFTANPNVSRQLYFDFGAFPATLEGLKFGIGIMRACADYDALQATHGASTADMVRAEHGELWDNATAAEVAVWVNRFCEGWA